MKIIIIGNSPNILKNERGKEIDTFDKIVRFNSFETINYEKYAGSRTDIWFINGVSIRKKNKRIMEKLDEVECEKIYIETNTRDTKETLLKKNDIIHNIKKLEFIDKKVFHETQKLYHNEDFNPHASLGLTGIYLIANKYTDSEIYIYGYDHFTSKQMHYMNDKRKCSDNNTVHPANLEKKFMNYLIKKYNIHKF